MLPGERLVGGVRCSEVLARLDAFADGTLSPTELAEVAAHVAGCQVCEAFGAHYAKLVACFRTACSEPDPVDAVATARLVAKLSDALDRR